MVQETLTLYWCYGPKYVQTTDELLVILEVYHGF